MSSAKSTSKAQAQQHQAPAAPITQTAAVTDSDITEEEVHVSEIILQVKEVWRCMFSAMSHVSPPAVAQQAAEAAMQKTAEYWSFRPEHAMEAVIDKCTKRLPLTFTNPALGIVLRTVAPKAVATLWKQIKEQRKAATGSSSYITEVTGKFASSVPKFNYFEAFWPQLALTPLGG